MIHTLSIDPSTKCGWALLLAGATVPKFGTWLLGEDLSAGEYFLSLCRCITKLRVENQIDNEDLQIVIEDNSLNAIGTAFTKHLAESWVGVIETWACGKKLSRPVAVGVNTWRSAFIGMSRAPKEVGAGMAEAKASDARRKWIKAATVAECKNRGLGVTDDNQADAIGILFWQINGGPVVQEQRRANKKAKTKAKRAQKRFLFARAA